MIGDIENTDNEENTENTAQTSQKTAEEMSLAEKYSQLQLSSQALRDEVRWLSERLNSASPSQASGTQNVAAMTVNRLSEVTIRRDFKICGQIGEKGQKDKLSYTNLMHQIDRGLIKKKMAAAGRSGAAGALLALLTFGFILNFLDTGPFLNAKEAPCNLL